VVREVLELVLQVLVEEEEAVVRVVGVRMMV
jgi:hypothetical protein